MIPGNIGVIGNCFEVLHIHVFLVPPLGSRRMSESFADQHQCGIPIREKANYAITKPKESRPNGYKKEIAPKTHSRMHPMKKGSGFS